VTFADRLELKEETILQKELSKSSRNAVEIEQECGQHVCYILRSLFSLEQ
jgi:hypothetical protein